MNNKQLYLLWAPIGKRWVDWVRPLLFVNNDLTYNQDYELLSTPYLNELKSDTAVFIDLPNHFSLLEGLTLAKLGYRPIPLFNGTDAPKNTMSLVNNDEIKQTLVWGSLLLQDLKIEEDAPPVFLLDSNRLIRHKMDIGVYDNSWDIYIQDVPSASYLLAHGISKIIVRSEKINRDLMIILYEYQKKGLIISLTNGFDEAIDVQIKKPPEKDKFH